MKVMILALSIMGATQVSNELPELVCSEVNGELECTLVEPVVPKRPSRYDKCKVIYEGAKACYA